MDPISTKIMKRNRLVNAVWTDMLKSIFANNIKPDEKFQQDGVTAHTKCAKIC